MNRRKSKPQTFANATYRHLPNHKHNVDFMMGRRWPDIKSTLDQCFVLAANDDRDKFQLTLIKSTHYDFSVPGPEACSQNTGQLTCTAKIIVAVMEINYNLSTTLPFRKVS